MKIRGGWIVDTVNGYASKSLLPNLSFVAKNYILIVALSHSCYENYLHATLFHLLLLNLFFTYFYTSSFLYIFPRFYILSLFSFHCTSYLLYPRFSLLYFFFYVVTSLLYFRRLAKRLLHLAYPFTVQYNFSQNFTQ